MRRCIAGVLAAAALVVVASAPAAVKKPHATVTFGQGVKITGAAFKPHEKLTVTLVAGDRRWARKVVAKAPGTFSLDLGNLGLNECNSYTLKVVGSLKSRFTTSHPTEPC